MAFTSTPGAAAPTAQELRIEICRDYHVTYTGTPEQLQAEGLIPEGTAAPAPRAVVRWQVGRYEYTLRACRSPAGCWALHISVPEHDWQWFQQQRLARLEQDVRRVLHQRTAQGADDFQRSWMAYLAARKDAAFQAFKAQVLPTRARRKAKTRATTTATQGA